MIKGEQSALPIFYILLQKNPDFRYRFQVPFEIPSASCGGARCALAAGRLWLSLGRAVRKAN